MQEDSSKEALSSTGGPGSDQASKAAKPALLPLIAAGLSVFDGILGLGFVSMWVIDATSAMSLIQTLAGACILLGLSAIVVGGLVLNSSSRTGNRAPGSGWARASIVSGLFLLGVTVLLPLISALSVLVGAQS